MRITIRPILTAFICVLLLTSCREKPRYSPDGRIFLQLYEPYDSMPDVLPLLQLGNPNLICLFGMGDTTSTNKFTFGIARMEEENPMSIEEAFNVFVKDVSPPMTKTLEAGKYKKRLRTFYRKISESDFGDYKTLNVMYYFMENDRSNILYELKATSGPDQKQFVMEQMEKMAKTVYFDNKPIK